jgi:uncharacterized membrane protein
MSVSAMSQPMYGLTLVSALACGLVAGVWFTFSGFVMDGLQRMPAPAGIAAMQSINRTAVRPPLMIALFGTAIACLVLLVWAIRSWGDRRAALVLAGSILYLLGGVGVTVAANVPLNNKLERLSPQAPDGAVQWTNYVHTWTAWNHVRAITCVAAAALLTIALTRD